MPKARVYRINKTIKNLVWDKYVGREKGVGGCYCCDKELDSKHFECGHVIAHCNGGQVTLENLRPVCSLCNKSMGKRNMEDFKKDVITAKIGNKNKEIEDFYNIIGFIDVRPKWGHFEASINLNNEFLDEFVNYAIEYGDYYPGQENTSLERRNIEFFYICSKMVFITD